MEIQIKTAVKAGNSSAVILPRAWLNKQVKIELMEKTPEVILTEVLEIIKKHIKLKEIIGVYLTGSYARGEEDKDSDIDILIITDNTDKETINEGIYSILVISQKLLGQKLKQDLFPIGQMLKEAKPLLNSNYLDFVKIDVTKKNIKWYLDTTEDKLKIIKKALGNLKIKKNGKNINDRIIYTLILRIRTLYIIKSLIKNQDYSKKDFILLIEKISKGVSAYESYLIIKGNLKNKNKTSLEEAERLYEYLKKQFGEINQLVRKN